MLVVQFHRFYLQTKLIPSFSNNIVQQYPDNMIIEYLNYIK